jgi:hypothetical protein
VTPASFGSTDLVSTARYHAKVGAGHRQYPRAGGVLVPRALASLVPAPLSRGALPSASAPRLRLGRQIVDEVAGDMQRLPADLRRLRLPPPSVVVRALPIEQRTRNVVERLVPTEAGATWTVERYLHVPRFGPRCLTDLLAAHQEWRDDTRENDKREGAGHAEGGGMAMAPRRAPESLVDVARRLRDRLPLAPTELRALLPEFLPARGPTPLRALLAAFQDAGMTPPFRIVGRNGNEIAVPVGAAGLAQSVSETASRQVVAWGIAEVSEVAGRVAVLAGTPGGETMVRRVLVALPRLRWLDERMTWFSFVEERSALRKAVDRIFKGAQAMKIVELAVELAKQARAVRRAPISVLTRYLTDIAGYAVVGGEVRRIADERSPERRTARYIEPR